MDLFYKRYLFDKHILVSESGRKSKYAPQAVLAFASMLAIRIGKGKEMATKGLIEFAASRLGRYVPPSFYRGFPETVRKLTPVELFFDQYLHYVSTYGFDNFDEPGYSLFEEEFTRSAFKEDVIVKDFDIVNEKDAIEEIKTYVNNLLSSTRPLAVHHYELVKCAIADYGVVIEKCACKDTAIKLLLDTQNVEYARFLRLSDFTKVVETLNFMRYDSINFKKLNLKNKDRVFLSKILDFMFAQGKINEKDCFEKQQSWCAYLHHIHYKPKCEEAKAFLSKMRTGKNESAYSEFEQLMSEGDVQKATELLIKEKGSAGFMRKVNYILSRCTSEEQVEFVMSNIETKNSLVIIQLLIQYACYKRECARSFKFTRFNRLVQHAETKEEAKNRKSYIPSPIVSQIVDILEQNLQRNLKGKLGKVYVSEDMKNIALPLQEGTSMGGFGTLPTGSKIILPDGKKLRAFTYWENVNDIDLSMIGVDENLRQHEFSWRNMSSQQSKAVTFSGDETAGYEGGSEFFDIDFDEMIKLYPKMRYYVFCDNVYSATDFSECLCRAGYMVRDVEDSGEVFEPKTVATSYAIDCKSTFAYMFALDIKNRHIIWLNKARESNQIVAGKTQMAFLLDYLTLTDVINVHSLFTMLASEIVDNPSLADVVVTDEEVETKEGALLIRSYDSDKILPLIN